VLINGRKAVIVRIAAFVFLGITAALLLPRHVRGEDRGFVPTVENVTGSLELDMRRIQTMRQTNLGDNITDLYSAIERLRLGVDGYVFHPRFMTFHLGGAVGLDQGYYTTPGYYSRTNHVFDEYDFSATLLPEHHYNLDVFSRRAVMPLSPSYPQENLATSQGAMFRYRERPLMFNMSAISQSQETGNSRFDATQYLAGGSHVIGPVTNSVRYNHADTHSSEGTQGARTNASFNNSIDFKVVSLASSIDTQRQNQTNPASETLESDSSSWSEILHMELPTIKADLQHLFIKDEITFGQLSPTVEPTTLSKTYRDSVSISHLLYQSLRTTYSAFKQSFDSTSGDTESFQEMLSFAYVKKIPSGELNANYSLADLSFTRTGTPLIASEIHTTIVPGTFTLSNLYVDPSTVTVMVTHPVTQILVPLTINVNYQILQFGGLLQLNILSLPGSIVFVPGASYDFTVSYTLRSTDSKTDMRTNTFHLGFNLFNGIFSPFFTHSNTDTKSSFGGIPIDDEVISNTYGYTVHLPPFTFYLDYSDYRSRLSPRKSINTWTEYRQLIAEDTDVVARFTYNETTRPATVLSPTYDEKSAIVDVSARKSFQHERLNLFIAGTYVVRSYNGTSSTSYALRPSLQWHFGMLDVTASASKTYTVTTGINGKQPYEEDTYYLTVSRKLF
jgi:hypothetical protein